jgi:hypothetical protein
MRHHSLEAPPALRRRFLLRGCSAPSVACLACFPYYLLPQYVPVLLPLLLLLLLLR